tara:strand:+ start:249 stop:449 length:201 start_codon:yes stop_codon:yes gene_type:complete
MPDNLRVLVPPGFLSPTFLISFFENINPRNNDHGIDAEKKLIKIQNNKFIEKPLKMILRDDFKNTN